METIEDLLESHPFFAGLSPSLSGAHRGVRF